MSDTLQFMFMGTATSTGLPLTPCLTNAHPYPKPFEAILPIPFIPRGGLPPGKGHWNPDGPWPSNVACPCCRSAVDRDVPDGWKNRRGNTGAVLRKKGKDGMWRNVVLDVGKTFREQATRFFPRWGVNSIDAIILTHGHADAYFGLDDLREWCVRQGTTIPVFLDRPTYEAVAKSFPYLVDSSQASGGGDIPSLAWNIIDDDAEFDVEGINVKALPVEHGIYFRVPTRSESPPSPPNLKTEPLICLGFMFDESIVYMSDVSNIPQRTWDRLLHRGAPAEGEHKAPEKVLSALTGLRDRLASASVLIPPTPDQVSRTGSPSSSVESEINKLAISSSTHADQSTNTTPPSSAGPTGHDTPLPPPLPILVIDSLWPLRKHGSHTNFPQALEIALRLRPSITYIVGVTHPPTHFMWEEICLAIQGKDGQRDHPDAQQSRSLVRKVWEDAQFTGNSKLGERVKEWGGRVEPAWDGLMLETGPGTGEGKWTEVQGEWGSVGGWGI